MNDVHIINIVLAILNLGFVLMNLSTAKDILIARKDIYKAISLACDVFNEALLEIKNLKEKKP